ncbi:hypothetical protein FZO89_07730 [Luteimonas viscosa]|uniref:Lipoprotein n=1 Tax=Luteimonas viscosa TaxID=1132694 RepID=A0A5D4XNA2_9GAMM|nr:hypothetical protein [Luteimonas viscosa]TYT26157.1 hypothetical protein FZO89_07730 [Luteimonas viscosa]
MLLSRSSVRSHSHRAPASAPLALLTVALLAACSPAPEPAQDASRDTAPATTAPAPVEVVEGPGATAPGDETIGGDGSEIRLDALTEQDLADADLSGELACSFSADDAAPILLARGMVASGEPAQGIVKVAGYVEVIRAPGGFDGILENPTFTGQGKTIVIAVTGPATGGGESPPRPATLTYQRADGASRTFDGRWQCGP